MVRRTVSGALVVALAVGLALPANASPGRFPVRAEDGFPTGEAPEVTAATWILYDDSADAVLAAQFPDEERAMASTTKIMTGMLLG